MIFLKLNYYKDLLNLQKLLQEKINSEITIYTIMQPHESITISLSPEILQKLEDGHYNKSKLIDDLLTKYFAAEKEKAKGEASK